MTTTTLTRPLRDEELRLEAEARIAAGPLAFVRYCNTCKQTSPPVGYDDTQACGDCGQAFPGLPFTWRTARDPEQGTVLILRRGDYAQTALAPSPDDEHFAYRVRTRWGMSVDRIERSERAKAVTKLIAEGKLSA